MWYGAAMKRALSAVCLLLASAGAAALAVAAPPAGGKQCNADPAPTVPSLSALMEKELHWGMSHTDVTGVYDQLNGLFDREYAPLLAKLQPGVQQQQLEADRDNRKANFERSLTAFDPGSPTGYDVTALHLEYTYGNGESVQKLFKDGKNRYFFYIKDRFWKMVDEVPLRADAPLGSSYQEAVTKLNGLLGVAGRVCAPDPSHGLERTETDWQDGKNHLRAVDRSGEHIVGIIISDLRTEGNLSSLRTYKAADPFALDPSVANITRGGISDPNAAHATPDAGKGKGRH
jgi:hypothetical protein